MIKSYYSFKCEIFCGKNIDQLDVKIENEAIVFFENAKEEFKISTRKTGGLIAFAKIICVMHKKIIMEIGGSIPLGMLVTQNPKIKIKARGWFQH